MRRTAGRPRPRPILLSWLAGLVLLAALHLGASPRAVAAADRVGLGPRAPWWFTDPYTSTGHVDAAATTAVVDTGGSGTVRLPFAPAALAFDPAASVLLAATRGGVDAWAFDGAGLVPAPGFDVPGSGDVGAAWIGGRGGQLAVATPSAVDLEAWTGARWTPVAALAVPGVTAVAAGPRLPGVPAAVLIGRSDGFLVAAYRGGALTVLPGAGPAGLAGVGGVSSAPGGSLAAVWFSRGAAAGAVDVFGWDGSAYRRLPGLDAPPGPSPAAGVGWMRQGDGYWVLSADGRLHAYAFLGSRAVAEPTLAAALPGPAAAVAGGWRQGDVATLQPGGIAYRDGAPPSLDAARSALGLALPLYRSAAVLESTVLAAGHAVDRLQVDATLTALPAGTAVDYQVSTDGGVTWHPVPACANPTDPVAQCIDDNTPLPPGTNIRYRMALSTADGAVTPVVDATSLYEIAGAAPVSTRGPARLIR